MGLFSRNKTKKVDAEPKPDTEPEKEAVVRVEKYTTSNKAYTRHTAEVTWNDGTTEEIKFDEMEEKENAIILSDYERYNPRKTQHTGCGSFAETRYEGGFEGQDFLTISMHSFRTFETVNREEKLMEYQNIVTERKRESEVEEDETVVDIVGKVEKK